MLSSSTILQNQLQNYFIILFVRNFQKLNSQLFRRFSSNELLLVPQVKFTISTLGYVALIHIYSAKMAAGKVRSN